MKRQIFNLILPVIALFAMTQTAFAQPIVAPAIRTLSNGGARILSVQGNTAANPAFGFTGNAGFPTNLNDGGGGNGIFRPAANTMAFSTLSLERMRISSTGNIGIGTTAPTNRLHVHATASASNTIANFSDSQNRHIFFVPKLAVGGYTFASLADDAGIFWSDNSGWNNTAGFVIAPQNGDWAGIRLAADGSASLPGYRTTFGYSNGSVSLGRASGSGLGWGTGYLGFNAARNKTGTDFKFEGDGANNGGNLIWGDVGGKIRFSTEPSTGALTKTRTEAQMLAQTKMSIEANGKVIIGPEGTTIPNNFRLYVRDGILTEHLTVAVYGSSSWPDYVFENDYKLPSLEEVEAYIQKEKHLPNVPSAQEMVEKGLDVATTDAMLLRKIEELTLYLIELKKENTDLKQAIETLQIKQK